MLTSNSIPPNDDLLLVVASPAALAAAGLDTSLIDAVPCPLLSTGDATRADAGSRRVMIGRLRSAKVGRVGDVDDVRLHLSQLSEGLRTIGRMSQEEIASIVELIDPAVDDRDHDRFKHDYSVLTVEEVAERLRCSPEMVLEREVAGEFFAAGAAGRAGEPRYPKFQLDERLNKSLLRRTIQEYRDAGVSTTLLWNFLRNPQKEFGGFTSMEMMLGASAPAYEALTPEEWTAAFLEVVSEELSRVRWVWGYGPDTDRALEA